MRAVSMKQASVLTAAVVALGAVALAPTVAASPAASGPGVWVQLSSGSGIGNIMDPSVHRFGSTLQVVWTQGSGANTLLLTRILAANGSAASSVRNVLPAWASLDEFPAIIGSGGQRVVVFSGIRSTSSSDPYAAGYNYYATSPDGLTWTLANGTIGSSNSAYGSYGSDATDAAGTPIAVFTAGTASDISFHTGFDSNPPVTADGQTQHNPACCAYYAGAGYSASSGQAWTAWYSNSGLASTDGVDAQRIYPTAGSLRHAPQSTTSYAGSISSVAPIQRVQVAARAGGGLFTAYGVGYPSQNRVALWRVDGSSGPLVLSVGHEVGTVGVAPAPGGRLWVFWARKSTSTIQAVRTNKGATRFGRVCSVRTPHGTTDVWKTAGDGANGRLDLVVNAGDGTAEQIYSTQVLPCLSGRVSPTSIRSSTGGTVTITVTDAGAAVSGAKAHYAGVTKTTNSLGQARFTVAAHTSKGRHAITFGHSGYTGGKVTFRVT